MNESTFTAVPAARRGAGETEAYLFCVLEAERPHAGSARHRLSNVDQVAIGRGAPRSAERSGGAVRTLTIKLPDGWLSQQHARLSRVHGRWILEDARSKNGSLVNGATVSRTLLSDGDLVELGHTFFLFREGLPATPEDADDVDGADLGAPAPGLATLLPGLELELAALAQVAASTVSVVVRGESGTGKELIARAVHELSRRGGAFVAVNSGALPDHLVEAELFGHRKGAFSGAIEDRPGLVRASDRGTLFLDEIGDLPAASQTALLRVLQEQEVSPVGETRPVKVDLRVVAATHRDLEAMVEAGEFRRDLYARLSGLTLTLPPLRDRREDLGLLVASLLRRAAGARAEKVSFAAEAARALFSHDWPLNVRELEKSLGTALVLAGGGAIEPAHLPAPLRAAAEVTDPAGGDEEAARPSPDDEQRRQELVALLTEHHGNVSAVARAMGKGRMQIHRWLKRFRLELETYRR